MSQTSTIPVSNCFRGETHQALELQKLTVHNGRIKRLILLGLISLINSQWYGNENEKCQSVSFAVRANLKFRMRIAVLIWNKNKMFVSFPSCSAYSDFQYPVQILEQLKTVCTQLNFDFQPFAPVTMDQNLSISSQNSLISSSFWLEKAVKSYFLKKLFDVRK